MSDTKTDTSVAQDVPTETKTTKKPRRVVNAETVGASFDEFQKLVEAQIETLRQASTASGKGGSTGIKFLRTVNSRIKQLKKDALKGMEASKKKPRRATKSDGGFLKPHKITAEMATFAGWQPTELKSRVEITNSICDYVRTHNLQDQNKRKHILPDEKLKKLLNYDPLVAGNEPLTYFYLQKLIGSLQDKPAKVVA